jgi:hypothetical protein
MTNVNYVSNPNQWLPSIENQVWRTYHWDTSVLALHLGARNNRSDLQQTIHSKTRFNPTLKLTLVWDVIPMHAFTSYQWFRPMLARCHCRCESNQGCTSHTRISQSNLFSSFLLCASPTHPCTLTASMHAHSGILRACMHSAHVPNSSYLDLAVIPVARLALDSRFWTVLWFDVTDALW